MQNYQCKTIEELINKKKAMQNIYQIVDSIEKLSRPSSMQRSQPSSQIQQKNIDQIVELPYGTYRGHVKDFKMEGKGVLYLFNGDVFRGTFRDNCIIQGTLLRNQIEYKGEFKDWLKTGRGIERKVNDPNYIFCGIFEDDVRNGQGYLLEGDTEYFGEFLNNRRHGQFRVRRKGQKQKICFYVNDNISNQALQGKRIGYLKQFGPYNIDRGNLGTLRNRTMISPTVLKAYYRLLENQYTRIASLLCRPYPRIKVMNQLMDHIVGQQLSKTCIENIKLSRGQTQNPGFGTPFCPSIFQYFDILLIPFQILREHFALLTIHVTAEYGKDKKFSFKFGYMDSIIEQGYDVQESCITIVKIYLKQQAKKLKQGKRSCTENEKLYAQTLKAIQSITVKNPGDFGYPNQNDSYSCGLWTAIFIRSILRESLTGEPIIWSSLTQKEVDLTREQIATALKMEYAPIFDDN